METELQQEFYRQDIRFKKVSSFCRQSWKKRFRPPTRKTDRFQNIFIMKDSYKYPAWQYIWILYAYDVTIFK